MFGQFLLCFRIMLPQIYYQVCNGLKMHEKKETASLLPCPNFLPCVMSVLNGPAVVEFLLDHWQSRSSLTW